MSGLTWASLFLVVFWWPFYFRSFPSLVFCVDLDVFGVRQAAWNVSLLVSQQSPLPWAHDHHVLVSKAAWRTSSHVRGICRGRWASCLTGWCCWNPVWSDLKRSESLNIMALKSTFPHIWLFPVWDSWSDVPTLLMDLPRLLAALSMFPQGAMVDGFLTEEGSDCPLSVSCTVQHCGHIFVSPPVYRIVPLTTAEHIILWSSSQCCLFQFWQRLTVHIYRSSWQIVLLCHVSDGNWMNRRCLCWRL